MEGCEYKLFVITSCEDGFYDLAEAIDCSNKYPSDTIFCYLDHDRNKHFSKVQLRELRFVSRMIEANGGHCFYNLEEVAKYINGYTKEEVDRYF